MRFVSIALLLLLGSGLHAVAAVPSLKRVMLSSGGVGYFEYAAEIDGDESLTLDVPLAEVDDILMSLVVFDGAGAVAGVELPGRDNTVQAFGDAPFGPEALESPVQYLNALRGTEVEVQGPRPMTGRIVRAEAATETADNFSTQRTRVTLLGADGLHQFVLEDADTVQVTDPVLRSRIDSALESLRRDAGATTRQLVIRLKGKGKRTVAVGYVAGAPLWKATYRLILPAGVSPTARLQGWATLENQSGTDWKGVALTLQYGNPVTFRQSLYRSYFVQRPEVPVEILGHVLPDIDTRARGVDSEPRPAPPPAPMAAHADQTISPLSMHRTDQAALAAAAEPAQTEATAEETIFALAQPVDLAAGHTANVPIVDREVPAARIGLVPFRNRHPLASVRVRNDDRRGLPAGVLTLYDATGSASFAGDARLGGLPAAETRLLSFAQDLRTTIETKTSPGPGAIVLFRVANGILSFTSRMREVIEIAAKGPAREARDLLLEIQKPVADSTIALEGGNATIGEQTETAFRIALSLAPGESRTITIWLDHPWRRDLRLIEDGDAVESVVKDIDRLDPQGHTALDHIVDLRHDEATKQARIAALRKLLEDAQTDEDRIRKNLGAVTAADPLRSRLTKALDADETKIEQLRQTIDDAQAEADKAHRSLADAVAALHI